MEKARASVRVGQTFRVKGVTFVKTHGGYTIQPSPFPCSMKHDLGGQFTELKKLMQAMLRYRPNQLCPNPKSHEPVFTAKELGNALDVCNVICFSMKATSSSTSAHERMDNVGGFVFGRSFKNKKQQTSAFDVNVPWECVADLGPFVFLDYICKCNQGPANVRGMIDAVRNHCKHKRHGSRWPIVIQPELAYDKHGKQKRTQPLLAYYSTLGFKKLHAPIKNVYMVLQ